MAGLTEIKANSASHQSWSWGLAELGKKNKTTQNMIMCLKKNGRWGVDNLMLAPQKKSEQKTIGRMMFYF